MKGKLKGSREILVAKICIFLLIIVGITGVTYYLLNKLFIAAIAIAILTLIGIAIFWWIIFEASKNLNSCKKDDTRKKVEKCKNFLKKHRFIRMAVKMELLMLVVVFAYYWLFDGERSEIEFVLVAYHVCLLAILILKVLDSKIESKLTKKQYAEDLKRVKEKFALKEGELVEVLLTPNDKTFTMRLSLGIQQEIETRYFALLEEGTISIVPVIGDKKLKPERMYDPETLEWEFTPMPKEDEDD